MPGVGTERYTYQIIWSEEDRQSVGLCAEFPGLSWLADSAADAMAGIRRVVAGVVDGIIPAGPRFCPKFLTTKHTLITWPARRIDFGPVPGYTVR